jgi:hypothetical protein
VLKPVNLKDKFGKQVYVGSILKARLVFAGSDVVGRVELDENDEPVLVCGFKRWPLRDVSIYGEVFRA